jgi:hypothetical protein
LHEVGYRLAKSMASADFRLHLPDAGPTTLRSGVEIAATDCRYRYVPVTFDPPT